MQTFENYKKFNNITKIYLYKLFKNYSNNKNLFHKDIINEILSYIGEDYERYMFRLNLKTLFVKTYDFIYFLNHIYREYNMKNNIKNDFENNFHKLLLELIHDKYNKTNANDISRKNLYIFD